MTVSIPFSKQRIGVGHPVIIIAEIGINHEGNAEVCKKMIEAAASAGVNAVKLQTIDPEENYVPETESYKLFKQAQLLKEDTIRLFEYARSIGIEIFTTIGDLKTFQWVQKLDPVAYKISSGLLTHHPLINEILKTGRTILVSTGMAGYDEINEVILLSNAVKNNRIGIFQCTSQYPAPQDSLHLGVIKTLYKKYNVPIGFSDHSKGYIASVLSVAAGACFIEKHFSLDPSRDGFDHKISLDPKGMKQLVVKIRQTEIMMGDSEKIVTFEQKQTNKKFLRSIVATCQIKKGTIIKPEMVSFLRTLPEKCGLPPKYINDFLGKRVNVQIPKYTALRFEDVATDIDTGHN